LPPTTSESVQVRPGLVFARLVPVIVTHDPASMPGWKLAPFTTDPITGGPGGTIFATNALPNCPAGGSTGLGKSGDQVCPATIRLPCESVDTASAPSSCDPPR